MDRILITSLDEIECAVFWPVCSNRYRWIIPSPSEIRTPLQDELAVREHLSTIRNKWKD